MNNRYHYRYASLKVPTTVLSRPALIEVLHTVTVASITSKRRGSPTEVPLDEVHGLTGPPSCVNMVSVYTVRKATLRRYVGAAGPAKMREVCAALATA